jgi:hypothetical protein
MSIPTPFSTNLPLTPTPFKSRVESNLNFDKNYYAVAFKPGFPLQASELNEIQEIFYVQQTLSNKLRTTGWTGAVPWNGATPLQKELVSFALTGDITFNIGWYLVQNESFNGGLGVWVYNSSVKTVTPSHTENSANAYNTKYGFIVRSKTIQCTTNGTPGANEDVTLQDQSNYNVVGGPCGAARMQLEVVRADVAAGAATGETFVSVFGGPRATVLNGSVILRTVRFDNGDEKQVG